MSKTWKVTFSLTVDAVWIDGGLWIDDGFALTPAILEEIIRDGIRGFAADAEKRVSRVVIHEVAAPQGEPLRCDVCSKILTPAETWAADDVTTYYATCDRCQDAV
jgi:hypothetical protein